MKSPNIATRERILEKLLANPGYKPAPPPELAQKHAVATVNAVTIDPTFRKAFSLFLGLHLPPGSPYPSLKQISDQLNIPLDTVRLWKTRAGWDTQRASYERGITTPMTWVSSVTQTQIELFPATDLSRVKELDAAMADLEVTDPEFMRLWRLKKELIADFKAETGLDVVSETQAAVHRAEAIAQVKRQAAAQLRADLRAEAEEFGAPVERAIDDSPRQLPPIPDADEDDPVPIC